MRATLGKRIAVLGRGPAVAATVAALGRLRGVLMVRQVTSLERLGETPWPIDMLVDMVGGLTPAYNAAMAAMGQGVAVITTSPLVMLAHGAILTRAAEGQGVVLGASAAGFGPVAPVLAAWQPQRVWVAPLSAARAVMERMAARGEDFLAAERHLTARGDDMSDIAGKVLHARAAALWASLYGPNVNDWPNLARMPRRGMDSLTVATMAALRPFGLQMLYASCITPDGIATGPVAVPFGYPLLAHPTAVLADTHAGPMMVELPADTDAALVASVVADVRAWLGGLRRPVRLQHGEAHPMVADQPKTTCFVDVAYGLRMRILAVGEVLDEQVSGDGRWRAIVMASPEVLMAVAPEALVLPLVEPYERHDGVRLVG
jgi:hypothetical protein